MDFFLTDIATHPTNKNTAYLLYSVPGEPKILRTTDLGQTWEDISGFGLNEESCNGFPDIAVLSLIVFPDEINTIWAGTEIGIFESTDNGETWSLQDNDLPPASIWQMFYQDGYVVVATYGRGIWTCLIDGTISVPDMENNFVKIDAYPNPATDYVNIDLSNIEEGEYKIELFDISGKKVLSEQFQSYQISEYQLDIANVKAGTYILRMKNKKMIYHTNIIKQN